LNADIAVFFASCFISLFLGYLAGRAAIKIA